MSAVRPAALGLLLACLAAGLGGALEVPGLQCHTDLDTEVFCHWEVTSTTNCPREFQLHVTSNDGQEFKCQHLKNRRNPESTSSDCVCPIIGKIKSFTAEYTFSLVTRTNQSKEYIFDLRKIVKPRPLRNLTVTKSKEQSFILAWKKSYDPSFILYRLKAFYQIQISAEGQKQNLIDLEEQTEKYIIQTDQLLAGKNYTARIRYTFVEWGTSWSEWSSPCRWFSDLGTEPADRPWLFILLVCFLVLVLVPTCYCGFARLKQRWWDRIPSPKIADDLGKKPDQVPWQMLMGDEGKTPLCATSPDLLERQLSFMDSLPKEDGSTFPGQPDKVSKMFSGRKWEVAVLSPEVPSVEPFLTICSPAADPGAQAEEEEDRVPRNDALVDLFLEILEGGGGPEGAESPEPVWEAPPPARAPEPVLGGPGWLGGTPRKSPTGDPPESGYQNTKVASSPRAASPAPEQHQAGSQAFSSSQYKLLLFPPPLPSDPSRAVVTDSLGSQADGGQGGPRATTPPPSCYKSFSHLVGQPTDNFHQLPWGNQGDFASDDQAQLLLLGGWAPCREEGLFSPPQQGAPSWNTPDVPGAVQPRLPGYRPFRAASQDPGSFLLGSPYKPLLEVFGSVPKEGPLEPTLGTREAEGEGWAEHPAFAFSRCREEEEEEEELGQEGAGQGTERFLVSQVPLATF